MPQCLEYYLGKSVNKKYICPFHNDKNASLGFTGVRFRCWSCGKSGDIVDFVMEYLGLILPRAVDKLAADFGYSNTLTAAERSDIEKRKRERERAAEEDRKRKRLELDMAEKMQMYKKAARNIKRAGKTKWSQVEAVSLLETKAELVAAELERMQR